MALWALVQRGHASVVCVLLAPLVTLFWCLHRNRDEGVELGWRRGTWYLLHAGERREAELARRAVLTPWVIQLDLQCRPRGQREHIRVFVDSVSPREWRLLRARLRLQCASQA